VWPSWTPHRFNPDTTMDDLARIEHLIDSARAEVVFQVLQYSTESRSGRFTVIDDALRRAAARGVKVRMVISDWVLGGRGLPALQELAQIPGIEVRISTLPEWSGGYIPFARVEHCKYVVVDSLWTWVGTSNWEPGYFHGSRNLAVTLRNRPLALEARKVFETSWTAPGTRAVKPGETYERKTHGMTPPPGKSAYGR